MRAAGGRTQGHGVSGGGGIRRGCVLLVLGAFLAARPVPAQELQYQIANQTEGYYDTKWKETLLDSRLDALVSHGRYSAGAVMVSHSPSDPGRLDPNNLGPARQGVRKRWLEAKTDGWDLRLGDAYAAFGRGLALQIFEDQTVDFDNAIDGVTGSATLGRTDFQFLAGNNSFGPVQQVLKAAHVGYQLPAGLRAGLHGVWSDNLGGAGQGRTGGDRLYGGLLQGALASHADVYGEYVERDQRNGSGASAHVPQGHAGYANINIYAGPVQLMAEYKDLLRYKLPQVAREDGTLQPFVNPPTAVRQHTTTLLNRGSHVANIRPDDERGGLAETYVTLWERTRLTGSYSVSKARRAKDYSALGQAFSNTRFPAWETYGELEHHPTEKTEFILRGGETEETIEEGGDPLFAERMTWGGLVSFPLVENWSGEISLETQGVQESNKALRPEDFYLTEYRNNLIGLTLSKSPNMSWGLTAERTDDPREEDKTWVWGEWNVRLGDRHQLLLGGGRLRGGQVCSGGVCKLTKPFEGGRIELLTTF
jgi:hypothetical protein